MLQVIFAYQKKAKLCQKQLLMPRVRSRSTLDKWSKLRYKEGVGVVDSDGRKVRDDWKQHVLPLASQIDQLIEQSEYSSFLAQYQRDLSTAIIRNIK